MVQPFPGGGGGSNFFQGSNCLFPIETNITCDFPEEPGPPFPPPDPHLPMLSYTGCHVKAVHWLYRSDAHGSQVTSLLC